VLILFEHDFGGLDYGEDFIAYLEFHFFGAALGDDALDEGFADTEDYVSHYAAELEFDDFALETIASGEGHGRRIRGGILGV
jgi:hypothetical protein